MQLTAENLEIAFKGFKTVFNDAYNQAPAFHEKIAMRVNSSSYSETYGWLGEFPAMREWVGARHEVKSLIWQVRADYDLQMITSDKYDHVFMYDEYKYGIRARANAGYGLWQMAYCSQAALTPENYALARASMASLTGDNGLPLGIEPSLLVVPYTLEAQARQLLKADEINGSSNIWKESAELIVTLTLCSSLLMPCLVFLKEGMRYE